MFSGAFMFTCIIFFLLLFSWFMLYRNLVWVKVLQTWYNYLEIMAIFQVIRLLQSVKLLWMFLAFIPNFPIITDVLIVEQPWVMLLHHWTDLKFHLYVCIRSFLVAFVNIYIYILRCFLSTFSQLDGSKKN